MSVSSTMPVGSTFSLDHSMRPLLNTRNQTYSLKRSDHTQIVSLIYVAGIINDGKTAVVKAIHPENSECVRKAQAIFEMGLLASVQINRSVELNCDRVIFSVNEKVFKQFDTTDKINRVLKKESGNVELGNMNE